MEDNKKENMAHTIKMAYLYLVCFFAIIAFSINLSNILSTYMSILYPEPRVLIPRHLKVENFKPKDVLTGEETKKIMSPTEIEALRQQRFKIWQQEDADSIKDDACRKKHKAMMTIPYILISLLIFFSHMYFIVRKSK